MSPAATGSWRRVLTVAGEEYRRALEGRWLLGFSVLLTALILGLSFFGLAQGREVGFQGFARVTLSLMNLVLLIVPLTGLMLGVASVANSTGALPLLLAQPVSRTEVFAGKFLGLSAALGVAQAVGFGAGGVTVSLGAGSGQIAGFAVLAALSLLLGCITIAAALMLSALWPDRVRASSAALALWLLMVVAYDLVVLGLTASLRGLPLQSLLLPAMLLNPVDLCRVLTTFAAGSGALFGPTSAVLVRFFGTGGGVAIALGILATQLAIPLVLGAWIFRRRDW
jgi:Cu-processing system permease protein